LFGPGGGSGEDPGVVRLLLPGLVAALVVLALPSQEALAARSPRISVQPLQGPGDVVLRRQIARMVRARGFRVVTSIPAVAGTAQYVTLAREHRLAGFVTADIEERRTRNTITLLVWSGATGSVVGRWSTSAPPKRLPRALARGFWKNLGKAIKTAEAPPSNYLPPAPPMRIDAGTPLEG
jgi:hypothetical protein